MAKMTPQQLSTVRKQRQAKESEDYYASGAYMGAENTTYHKTPAEMQREGAEAAAAREQQEREKDLSFIRSLRKQNQPGAM
jgi:hypothetical protein